MKRMGSVEAGWTLPCHCRHFILFRYIFTVLFYLTQVFPAVTEAVLNSMPGIELIHKVEIQPTHLKSGFNWMLGCCEDPQVVVSIQHTVRRPDLALARKTFLSLVAVKNKYQVDFEVQQTVAVCGDQLETDSNFDMITPQLCLESFICSLHPLEEV